MRLEPDPKRLAYALRHHDEFTQALRDADVATIGRIVRGAKRVNFTIGGVYQLVVFGGPPKPPADAPPQTVEQELGKLAGIDFSGTAGAAETQRLMGVYKGRRATIFRPHEFRLLGGQAAILGDMDILGWRKS